MSKASKKTVKMALIPSLAVLAAPFTSVTAAPLISCTRNISFGVFLPLCGGSIVVRASAGSATVNNGCHDQISGAIQPARCTVRTTIGVATQDVRVTFTRPQTQFGNTLGGGQVTLDNYTIQTASGSAASTHTFSAALLNPSHSFKVGGRIRFDLAEARGRYSNSSLSIVVTSIP